MMINNIIPKKVVLETKDNFVLQGNLYMSSPQKCVLLLHQFSKNKESWNSLITRLVRTHSVFSIDLRGHGESSGNYEDFQEKDFINMQTDVKTAINFLETRGFKKQNISIIGSSIGANLAQNYAVQNIIDKTILLSPGTNYKGIPLTIRDTKALIIVSKEDDYSYKTVKELEKRCPFTECIYLEDKGHGIYMVDDKIASSILLFLNE